MTIVQERSIGVLQVCPTRTAAAAALLTVALQAAVVVGGMLHLAATTAVATSICVMSAKRTSRPVQPSRSTCARTRATGPSSVPCAARHSLPRET